MSKKIIDLFPTPVFKTNLIDTEQYDELALSELAKYLMSDGAPANPELQIGEGDMKTCYMEDWKTTSYVIDDDDELCDAINASLSQFAHAQGTEYVKLADSWYTVMNKGSRIHRHRHESNVICGTLFVSMPEGSHGLAFVNPTTVAKMEDRVNTSTKYSEAAHLMEVKNGDLLIYPSWLEHFVPPVECDDRVTISFNADYSRFR